MTDNYKEVFFGEYCKTCIHKDKTEDQNPCDICLEEPVNLNSHKPVQWEEKI